jgi:hypothetical protein
MTVAEARLDMRVRNTLFEGDEGRVVDVRPDAVAIIWGRNQSITCYRADDPFTMKLLAQIAAVPEEDVRA